MRNVYTRNNNNNKLRANKRRIFKTTRKLREKMRKAKCVKNKGNNNKNERQDNLIT